MLARGWAPIFGEAAIAPEGDGWRVDAGDGDLRFVAPKSLLARYPGVALPVVAPPWIAAVTIESDQAASVKTTLANGAIVELAPSPPHR